MGRIATAHERRAAVFVVLNVAVRMRKRHKMIVCFDIERSLRDARVSAIWNRGLKPTANHERSLRDARVSAIWNRGLKPTANHERSLRDVEADAAFSSERRRSSKLPASLTGTR